MLGCDLLNLPTLHILYYVQAVEAALRKLLRVASSMPWYRGLSWGMSHYWVRGGGMSHTLGACHIAGGGVWVRLEAYH